MGHKILKFILFLAGIFPVFCFGIAAYAAFQGKVEFWGPTEGVIFSLSALLFLYLALKIHLNLRYQRHNVNIQELKSHGQKVMTQFKALDRRWNIEVNGQSPIVIYTQHNGQVFASEDLWFSGEDSSAYEDPRFQTWQKLQYIDPNKKYLIPVYINPTKKKEYYMDLAGLHIE